MANGGYLLTAYLERISELRNDLRVANEATAELLARAARAERELERLSGLLDEARTAIASYDHEHACSCRAGHMEGRTLPATMTASHSGRHGRARRRWEPDREETGPSEHLPRPAALHEERDGELRDPA